MRNAVPPFSPVFKVWLGAAIAIALPFSVLYWGKSEVIITGQNRQLQV
jgi:hypothetical protein